MEIFHLINPQYYFLCIGIISGYFFLWLIRKKEWSFYLWFTYVTSTVAVSLYVISILAGFTSLGWPYSFIAVLPVLLLLIPIYYLVYLFSKKTLPPNSFKAFAHKVFVAFYLLFLLVFPGWLYSQKTTKTVTFYAVDQFNNPVSNLSIRYETSKFPITTDENGFAVINFPYSIFPSNNRHVDCEVISRKGYEIGGGKYDYNLGRDMGTYNYNIGWATELGFPYRVNIFMRKKELPTYLYHEERFQWYSEHPIETVRYNIFKRGLQAIDSDISILKNPDKVDLVFHVERDMENKHYTLKITAPLATNGVLLDDKKFYKAPAEGYTSEVVITLNYDMGPHIDMEKYLYFKSRNLEYKTETGKKYKPIYSRMNMEILFADSEHLNLYYDTWTNPYGSPNLDYEQDMPLDLRHDLRRQAKRTIEKGLLPPEPNINELIASGKYPY